MRVTGPLDLGLIGVMESERIRLPCVCLCVNERGICYSDNGISESAGVLVCGCVFVFGRVKNTLSPHSPPPARYRQPVWAARVI